MENGAFSTPEFATWSKDYVLFCHITSRLEDAAYPNLLSEKNGGGFPHVAYLDSTGGMIAIHRDKRDVGGFQKTFDSKVKPFLDLTAKAESGDKAAIKALFMLKLDGGTLSLAEAKEGRSKLELDDAEKKMLDGKIVDLEYDDVLAGIRSRDDYAAAGGKLAAMLAANKMPGDQRRQTTFWILIGMHAEADANAELFEKVVSGMEDLAKDNPRLGGRIEQMKKTLETLKAKKDG